MWCTSPSPWRGLVLLVWVVYAAGTVTVTASQSRRSTYSQHLPSTTYEPTDHPLPPSTRTASSSSSPSAALSSTNPSSLVPSSTKSSFFNQATTALSTRSSPIATTSTPYPSTAAPTKLPTRRLSTTGPIFKPSITACSTVNPSTQSPSTTAQSILFLPTSPMSSPTAKPLKIPSSHSPSSLPPSTLGPSSARPSTASPSSIPTPSLTLAYQYTSSFWFVAQTISLTTSLTTSLTPPPTISPTISPTVVGGGSGFIDFGSGVFIFALVGVSFFMLVLTLAGLASLYRFTMGGTFFSSSQHQHTADDAADQDNVAIAVPTGHATRYLEVQSFPSSSSSFPTSPLAEAVVTCSEADDDPLQMCAPITTVATRVV